MAGVSYDWNLPVACGDEEAPQVSVLQEGQDDEGHRERRVLLSVQGDTLRTHTQHASTHIHTHTAYTHTHTTCKPTHT